MNKTKKLSTKGTKGHEGIQDDRRIVFLRVGGGFAYRPSCTSWTIRIGFGIGFCLALLAIGVIFTGCGETNSGQQPQQSDSGNLFLNVGSGFMPGNTGGYLVAGTKLLSSFTVSEADEDQLGQAVAVEITNARPLISDRRVSDYVALVGYTVTEASPRPDGNFVFGVLDTEDVGAYSGPNGYIFITRGAITHMRDEAELAGVLAHEIAHVCHEDGLNAIRNARQNDAAATALSTALSHSDNTGALDASTDLVFRGVFTKGYERSQELDADRAAVHYIANAGYDPASYQRFVERISSEQHGGQSGLFSTHPGFRERAKVVADEVAKTGKAGAGATNAERFDAETASVR